MSDSEMRKHSNKYLLIIFGLVWSSLCRNKFRETKLHSQLPRMLVFATYFIADYCNVLILSALL